MKYLENLGDLEKKLEKLNNMVNLDRIKIHEPKKSGESVDENGRKVLWGLAILGAIAAVIAIAVAVYKILTPEPLDDFDDDFDDDFFNDEEEKTEEASEETVAEEAEQNVEEASAEETTIEE